MRDTFKDQLESSQPLSEEILEQFLNKFYFNGEEMKVGEVVLFAMLLGDSSTDEYGNTQIPMNVIKLNERHLDLFKNQGGIVRSLPIISRK